MAGSKRGADERCMHMVRIGVKFGVDIPSRPDDLVQLATCVETAGFHSFWVGDHVVIPRAIDVGTHYTQVGGNAGFADRTEPDRTCSTQSSR
jgi:alkanesulfonate monooxygenase SsuD/methylene tetrahydromethanopterin reductase-like flavin-dependent oxidoreductase (luciferase family)